MSLLKNLGDEPLKTFTVSLDYTEAVAIKDFKDVGSHSWTQVDDEPILVIPGAPARWTNPSIPLQVAPDQGTRFIDHTGAQCDKQGVHRLAPVFQSVDFCTPNFDYKQLDIICNRNNLRNLLHWVEYSTKKDFRIDLHLINGDKTLVMVEHEVSKTEDIPEGAFRGYGDNFRQRAVIAPPGQTRHNRIVTYTLGDFRLLMGHKVEAAFRDKDTQDDVDFLANALGKAKVGKAGPTRSETPGTLQMRQGEDPYKQYKFVEIKTMSQRKEIDWKDFYPQLYLSQTAQVRVARHDRGTFRKMETYDIFSKDLKNEQEIMELRLAKLALFLKELRSTLRELGVGPWSLVCKQGTLRLYDSKDDPLPDFILSRFNVDE